MREFTFLEKRAEEAENLDAFSGLKLLHIKKKIKENLALIGRYEIFDQYTKHDISHINQLLDICEWLIPEGTKSKLTPADCLMIVLSIYFHDLGMLVTKDEYSNRNHSGFVDYKDKVLNGEFGLDYKAKIETKYQLDENEAEHFLYQEFVRKKHAERIKYWIQGKQKDELGISDKIVEEVNDLLNSLPPKFRLDLGIVCESHHLSDLDDFKKYSISFPYGRAGDETANMHYAALILRSSDLLHITADRTPTTEFRLINPSDPISQIEWIKQSAVSNVRGKIKRDKEGKPDPTLAKDTIEVTAFFDSPDKSEAFFSLISYLNYTRKEIKQTNFWAALANKEQASEYFFPWKDINDDNVRTQGFERELFQFNLDQNKILNLLVGHTLYNDSTVVLRELIQNSIDAIRLYRYQKKLTTGEEIQIKWDSNKRVLEFIDTGTGMDRSIIENHLLKVGSSRYQDERFLKSFPDFSPISRFGIGILTCFLISNEIEITTITDEATEALNLSIKDVDGKYLLRSVPMSDTLLPIKKHGTKISLKVRHDIEMADIVNDIKKWILFPACKLVIKVDNKSEQLVGYDSPKEALEKYLLDLGFELNDSKVKVIEETVGGITMAYGLQYSQYFKEWDLIHVKDVSREIFNPVGTAVEGIRVEFDSPGFKGQRLIAIANAKGKNAPKTNVARSHLENTEEKRSLLESIYSIYINHIKKEIDNLNKIEGFSITWAALETTYLLGPLLNKRRSEDKSEIANIQILRKVINSINGILIEHNNTRKAVSAETLASQKEFITIDCDLYRSVESMLKEVSNESSLSKILGALYGQGKIDFDNQDYILCGYDSKNILHRNATEQKEVSGIKLYHDKRRVDLVWGDAGKEKIWFQTQEALEDDVSRPYFTGENFLLQTGNVQIDGLKDEIAIGAFHNIYFLKGSSFHQILYDLYKKDKTGNDYINQLVFEQISSMALNFLNNPKEGFSKDDVKKYFDHYDENQDRKYSSILGQSIWEFIDRNLVLDAVILTRWKKFDTYFWNRRNNRYLYW